MGLFLVGTVQARQLPPSAPPTEIDNTPSFQLKVPSSDKERAFYWQNTTLAKEGYLRIVGSDDFVNLIDEARMLPFLKFQIETPLAPSASAIRAAGFPFVATWVEDPFRTTMIFGDEPHGFLMYTVFNYEKAHAKLSVVSDFVQYRIKGSPAVLSLTVNKANTKGLWKLSFWRAGVGHEIYLTEKFPANPAQGNKQKILLNLGNSLAN
ncbi:MAG: hypothetical protein ACXWC4_02315 [Telluria sp.]